MFILYGFFFCTAFKYALLMDEPKSPNSITESSSSSVTPVLNITQLQKRLLDTFPDTIHDHICSLSKAKKITLCERILQKPYYKAQGIHLNKAAFLIHSATCQRHFVKQGRKTILFKSTILRKMYPCYSKHNPIRSNYRIDDYFDKFYLAAGTIRDSIIVYIRLNNSFKEFADVYKYDYPRNVEFDNYFENIGLDELPETFLQINDIWAELQEEQNTYVTTNVIEIENIYVQEIVEFRQMDAICNLEQQKTNSLCQKIFEHHTFKSMGISMNIMGQHIFRSDCEETELKFRFSKYYKIQKVTQLMYTCYSRGIFKLRNILTDPYLTTFSISEGPRENSVLVYKKNVNSKNIFLFLLFENVYFDKLMPMNISSEQIMKESQYTTKFLENINLLVLQRNYVNRLRMFAIEIWIKEEIQLRIESIKKNLQMSKAYSKSLTSLESEIYQSIIRIIRTEENLLEPTSFMKYVMKVILDENLLQTDLKKSEDNFRALFQRIKKIAQQTGQQLYQKNTIKLIQGIKLKLNEMDENVIEKISLKNLLSVILKEIDDDFS